MSPAGSPTTGKNPAVALLAHDRAAVEAKGRRIAAALIAVALDPATRLPMADRLALAALARVERSTATRA